MINSKFHVFKDYILDYYPNAKNIRQPSVRGSQNNVLFADVKNQSMVFKFGKPEMVAKNVLVSQLYLQNGIPVPEIKQLSAGVYGIEEYRALPGHTLYESVGAGMSNDKIKQVYREILMCFVKMSKIAEQKLNGYEYKYLYDIAGQQVSATNNSVLGRLCQFLVYLASVGPDKNRAIYHADITPKNVVVSDDGHLSGFLDVDTIAVCEKNHAFAAMAAKYQQLGFDIGDLISEYENISGDKLLRSKVYTIADIYNFGKKILWAHSQKRR